MASCQILEHIISMTEYLKGISEPRVKVAIFLLEFQSHRKIALLDPALQRRQTHDC